MQDPSRRIDQGQFDRLFRDSHALFPIEHGTHCAVFFAQAHLHRFYVDIGQKGLRCDDAMIAYRKN